MSDFALQRKNMVESQIRPSDVTDRRVLRAMQTVPREAFVPEGLRDIAYMDDAVPLGGGQGKQRTGAARALMSPRTFAKLLVLADIEATDRVLVVGAGCGYSSAVIAEIAASVLGLECDRQLLNGAREAIAGIASPSASKITLTEGELASGTTDKGPFDVIVIEGSVPELPKAISDLLAPGGRCVGVRVRGGVGHATIWRRIGGQLAETDVFEAHVAELPGFAKAPAFSF